MAALAAIAVVALVAAWLEPRSSPLAGHPQVIDGDTLRLGTQRVRLTGIDAPELDQTCTDAMGAQYACGTQAKAVLAGLVGGGEVSCVRSGRDRYGRTLATCTSAGRDLAEAMAEAGWAVAEADHALAALSARAAGRGIWQGRFEDPAQWRRDHGASEPTLWDWIRAWFQ